MSFHPEKLSAFPIRNFFTDEEARVVPLDESFLFSENTLTQIASICNQPQVYDLLFQEWLQGKAYTPSHAQSFVAWAQTGWRNGSYFVFLILDKKGNVLGAVDIKSSDPQNSEVGYWMDARTPGFMTNALIGLLSQARNTGYQQLFAFTKIENAKSQAVLTRAGFISLGNENRPEGMRVKFVKKL